MCHSCFLTEPCTWVPFIQGTARHDQALCTPCRLVGDLLLAVRTRDQHWEDGNQGLDEALLFLITELHQSFRRRPTRGEPRRSRAAHDA